MSYLNSEWIKAEAEDGELYTKKVEFSVIKGGIFSVEIPDELTPIVKKILEKRLDSSIYIGNKRNPRYSSEMPKDRLYGENMKAMIAVLESAAKDFVTVAKTIDRVIAYRFTAEVAFWIEDGNLFPSGRFAKTKGAWWIPKTKSVTSPTANDRMKSYNVGIVAQVFDRNTFVRKSGTSVTYDRVDPDLKEGILNGFPGVRIDPERERCEFVDYSDEAAKFFLNYILAICKIARAMDDFFADKKALAKAIEAGSLPKLLT